MIHSTSLRATGSPIEASMRVASSVPLLRRASIARLTNAMSASVVSGVGACAKGGLDGEIRARAPGPEAVVEPMAASDAPGRDRGRGTSSAARLVVFLSLPFASAFLVCLPCLAAVLTAVLDALLAPLWAAVASAAAE